MDEKNLVVVKFLDLLEVNVGGPDVISDILRNVAKNHPRLWAAWTAYMHACCRIVVLNPEATENMASTTAKVVLTCLTGEGLEKIAAKIKIIDENPDMPENLRQFHKEELLTLLSGMNPNLPKVHVKILPNDLRPAFVPTLSSKEKVTIH